MMHKKLSTRLKIIEEINCAKNTRKFNLTWTDFQKPEYTKQNQNCSETSDSTAR